MSTIYRDPVNFADPTGDPSGEVECRGQVDKWVAVRGLSGGTLTIEGSHDGTNFIAIASTAAANIWVEIPQPVWVLRLSGAGLAVAGEVALIAAEEQ